MSSKRRLAKFFCRNFNACSARLQTCVSMPALSRWIAMSFASSGSSSTTTTRGLGSARMGKGLRDYEGVLGSGLDLSIGVVWGRRTANLLEGSNRQVSFGPVSDQKPLLMIGLPKGSLEEATLNLFAKAGWKIAINSRSDRPAIDDAELD